MNTVLTSLAARVRELIRCSSSAAFLGTDEPAFDALALELFRAQFELNPAYRALVQARGIRPDQVKLWREIPAVPARAFKELELTSLPPAELDFVFWSSGTTGHERSRHFHSRESVALYEASLRPWFAHHLLRADGPAPRLLALTPPPEQAPHSSLVHMLDVVLREHFPQAAESFFGRAQPDGAWELEFARLASAIGSAQEARQPVLLLGTAFSFVHWLDGLAEVGGRMPLLAGSRVMETGGYKGRSRELPRAQLHAALADVLGLAAGDIVTEYGMSELSSQAYDSPDPRTGARHFRFPPWARALVVSPDSGREVADGERGRLRLFDLANVWSVLAVQTEDVAIRRGDGFELLGRAAAAEPRGCSLMSA